MKVVTSQVLQNAVAENVRQEIVARIAQAEAEHQVKVLYAVESGSRAWGFASTNSDYDVRFIYAHEADWYLSMDVEDQRDVIEYPIVDEIDINGWDVRKALRLFRKSNPAMVEWLSSALIYADDGVFARELRPLLKTSYSLNKGIFHYLNMARTNYRGYLKSQEVRVKKYFYVLRPLLAIRWLLKYQSVAPIEFEKLLTLLDEADVREQVERLLVLKRNGQELDSGPQIVLINQFIEQELNRYETLKPLPNDSMADSATLNRVFRCVLNSL
ncbi:nucleotidyltransferase domain-containing protein [Celerinatantimonas sp. MCCC 1A17872]|uniref:nucleotidyltransferase domain-containing protein n=1 Tax=Celerinatantimonas sp. MCCC 1A17872 TaxID=3177514 RepID=UPI0038C647F1